MTTNVRFFNHRSGFGLFELAVPRVGGAVTPRAALAAVRAELALQSAADAAYEHRFLSAGLRLLKKCTNDVTLEVTYTDVTATAALLDAPLSLNAHDEPVLFVDGSASLEEATMHTFALTEQVHSFLFGGGLQALLRDRRVLYDPSAVAGLMEAERAARAAVESEAAAAQGRLSNFLHTQRAVLLDESAGRAAVVDAEAAERGSALVTQYEQLQVLLVRHIHSTSELRRATLSTATSAMLTIANATPLTTNEATVADTGSTAQQPSASKGLTAPTRRSSVKQLVETSMSLSTSRRPPSATATSALSSFRSVATLTATIPT